MKALLITLLVVSAPMLLMAQPDTLWTRIYPDLNPAQPVELLPSFTGGLVWAGSWLYHADTLNGHSDLIARETDGLGNPRWTFRVQGVTDDTIWSAEALCRTADSCYLVMGRRYYQGTPDVVIFKLDRDGAEIWRHSYRFSNLDLGYSLATHEDNTAVLCMTAVLHNDTFNVDVTTTVLVKLNSNGDTVWTYQTYFGPGRVVAISDGWMMLSFSSYPTLIKVDQNGHMVWRREYYDVAIGEFEDLVETPQGYFVAGKSWTYGSDNFSLLHVGFDGEPITVRQFIPDQQRDERVIRIVRTADGGMMLGGYAMAAEDLHVLMMMIKVDSLGARQWRTSMDIGWQTYVSGFCALPDGGFAMGGLANGNGGGFGSCFLVRYGATTSGIREHANMVREFRLEQNYPNPFNPRTEIAFDLPKTSNVYVGVYDVLGREVAKVANGLMTAGHHTFAFDGSKLASGLYFYTLSSAGVSQTKKMLLMK
jgi:hypothetical protein